MQDDYDYPRAYPLRGKQQAEAVVLDTPATSPAVRLVSALDIHYPEGRRALVGIDP